MEERSTGIILRTRPLTETSLIVQWLTPEVGRIATVAKGARRPKSPFAGKIDLYYEADFSFLRSRRSELHTLRELVLADTHSKLRENIGWLRQAAYFGVLIERSTETETPIPELFELFRDVLRKLPEVAPTGAIVVAFELKLLSLLGFEPDLESSRLSPGIRQIASGLMRSDWSLPKELESGALPQLQRYVGGLIGSALERIPPQREAALRS